MKRSYNVIKKCTWMYPLILSAYIFANPTLRWHH